VYSVVHLNEDKFTTDLRLKFGFKNKKEKRIKEKENQKYKKKKIEGNRACGYTFGPPPLYLCAAHLPSRTRADTRGHLFVLRLLSLGPHGLTITYDAWTQDVRPPSPLSPHDPRLSNKRRRLP
jgi:hypothetical protein